MDNDRTEAFGVPDFLSTRSWERHLPGSARSKVLSPPRHYRQGGLPFLWCPVADEKKSPPYGLKILATGYTMVPHFWVKCMGVDRDKDGQRLPVLDLGIHASFWKYSLVLWNAVVGFGCVEKNFTAKKTMQDFGIRPATALRWTAAYMASGLFDIRLGRRHVKGVKGEPSIYRYLNGTEQEWDIFLRCLSWLCRKDKSRHESQEGSEGSIAAFRAALTWAVGVTRKNEGVHPAFTHANSAYLKECLANGIAREVPGSQLLHKVEFARTPTNRMGVLEKAAQVQYYELDREELIDFPIPE